MTERTTVRLPDELLARAKRKAETDGRTLTALIEEGLRRVLSDRPRAEPRLHTPLPVSKAGGGVMPGIDLNNSTALQELEDELSAARLMRPK